MNARSYPLRFGSTLLLAAALTGCGNDVSSDEQARRAYLGLDVAVGKSLKLGFDGFNAASSANIDAQSTTGDATGTLVIAGQVDQGSSDNKGMRLRVGMTDYSDGKVTVADETVSVTYATVEDVTLQPALDLSLRSYSTPNGTFTGTLVGDFDMTGDLEGKVTLNLTMNGQLEQTNTGLVQRKTGTTTVTGTATNAAGGSYTVETTL